MEKLLYREAILKDLPTLMRFEQLLIDSERPYDSCIKCTDVTYYDMNRLISESDTYVLVAESGDRIVGSGYPGSIRRELCNSRLTCSISHRRLVCHHTFKLIIPLVY